VDPEMEVTETILAKQYIDETHSKQPKIREPKVLRLLPNVVISKKTGFKNL
jgi:hypothetical protein